MNRLENVFRQSVLMDREHAEVISKKTGRSIDEVIVYCYNNEIPASAGQYPCAPWRVKWILEYFYNEKKYSKEEIANEFDIGRNTVHKWIKERGIAEQKGRWRDGCSWRVQRKEVLKMDNRECVKCSSSTNLEVHHIIPRKHFENDRMAHSTANLVTLCSECHKSIKTSTPRQFFIEHHSTVQ